MRRLIARIPLIIRILGVVPVGILPIREGREPHVSWHRSLVPPTCVAVHADPQIHLPPPRTQPAPFPSSGLVVVQLLDESPVFPEGTLLGGYFLPGRQVDLVIVTSARAARHTAQFVTAVPSKPCFTDSAGQRRSPAAAGLDGAAFQVSDKRAAVDPSECVGEAGEQVVHRLFTLGRGAREGGMGGDVRDAGP